MSDPDDDRTTVSRVPAIDDEATTISRVPAIDDEATTITRAVVDDDATTITRSAVDDDATTITRSTVDDDATTITRSAVDDDATTVSRGGVPDERTVVSAGRAEPIDDATQIRGTARPGVDESTKLTDDRRRQQRGPRASAPAPGRLSGGRVAFVPGEKVQSYQVRDRTPVIDNVVRTVIPAPSSPTRQSRNTVAIETATKRKTSNRGIGVIIAIVVVTVLAVAIVGGVIAVLFLF